MIVRLLVLTAVLAAIGQAQTPPIEPGVSQDLAKWRAERYSNVRYKLHLTLEKMSPILKGTIEIRVTVAAAGVSVPPAVAGGAVSEPPALAGGTNTGQNTPPIILDWRRIRGSENLSTVSNVSVNGVTVAASMPPANAGGSDKTATAYEESSEHLIFRDGVVAGENVIKLDFTSPILTSGSAITRYVDKEDGSEYIYSLFVPSDASTAFPVFDQPDLKARFTLTTSVPDDWTCVSNGTGRVWRDQDVTIFPGGRLPQPWNNFYFFQETKPISTYVFAFAAGPFERVSEPGAVATGSTSGSTNSPAASHPVATAPGSDRTGSGDRVSVPPAVAGGAVVPGMKSDDQPQRTPPATAGGTDSVADTATSIYVRKSQAAKFKPHASEVFRLNREAIKYFETYFDYKFPFPKYDLVLIPEFPFGGMEHAGATFLRESSVIFPQEPTKNDYISRATLIFHEAAHQWFGDTVTMRWFDDLWLKEGFATFTAYKAMEKIMPEYNAWKVFYERVKQAAYQTDSTKGTTPIYQEIKNLSAAKSAYGAIVYNKAPAFLRQAEFYLGEDKFQTAVRAFLKKHEFGNAGWEDLVNEFETTSRQDLKQWADAWVKTAGLPTYYAELKDYNDIPNNGYFYAITQVPPNEIKMLWPSRSKRLLRTRSDGRAEQGTFSSNFSAFNKGLDSAGIICDHCRSFRAVFQFANYGDYGYGIFLLDPKSRDYVLKNIQNENDDFLRTMMWGALWDGVREGEMDPRAYVDLVVKNIKLETDESTIQTLLGRVSTAMRYYIDARSVPPAVAGGALSEPPASAGGTNAAARATSRVTAKRATKLKSGPPANAGGSDRLEALLIDRMQNAPTPGQKITYYRAFLNLASSENARRIMKDILKKSMAQPKGGNPSRSEGAQGKTDSALRTLPTGRVSASVPEKLPAAKVAASTTKDRFDIVTRLIILGDPDAPKLLADLERTETSDDAKRYAYAAKAGIPTAESKAKFWNDFVNNKDLSESWIEAAFGPFNNIRHSSLTLKYLEPALKELPNHKRNRKIFFVNGWLGAFIGGQNSEPALAIVNKFLSDNPDLDKDLRLKVLENLDIIERAVKIRAKYGK